MIKTLGAEWAFCDEDGDGDEECVLLKVPLVLTKDERRTKRAKLFEAFADACDTTILLPYIKLGWCIQMSLPKKGERGVRFTMPIRQYEELRAIDGREYFSDEEAQIMEMDFRRVINLAL